MTNAADCQAIFTLLKGSEKERTEGVRLLFEQDHVRKSAFYWHRRHVKWVFKKFPEWQDLYAEIIFRLIDAAEKGAAPRGSCEGWTFGIGRIVCIEALREIMRDEQFDKAVFDLSHDRDTGLADRVEAVLGKLGCKCETLLRYRYLQNPPVKDAETLAEILAEDCGSQIKASAIAVHLSGCRDKFRAIGGAAGGLFD